MAAGDVMADVCLYILSNIGDDNSLSATHIEIANEIGTVREVVGRKLRQLALENIVSLKRRTINLIDVEKLKHYL
jgi:CRP-like cAMP-binding protein